VEPEGGGFPNGRRLRDDAADFMLNIVSAGKMATDNVSDDSSDQSPMATASDGRSDPPHFPISVLESTER
jgi:hypothetical protein